MQITPALYHARPSTTPHTHIQPWTSELLISRATAAPKFHAVHVVVDGWFLFGIGKHALRLSSRCSVPQALLFTLLSMGMGVGSIGIRQRMAT